MSYAQNKQRAIFRSTKPTKTDQSQAAHTDINIIVTQFLRTGQAPDGPEPVYADFTVLPDDLRGFIELGRSIEYNRAQLPDKLREIPLEVLATMTNNQLAAILKPQEKPADKPTDKPKEEPKT